MRKARRAILCLIQMTLAKIMPTLILSRIDPIKPEGSGVSNEFADLLRRYSLQNVQVRAYCMEYRTATLQGDRFYEDMKLLFKTALPFYRKWTQVPDDYEELYQQVSSEIKHPDFVATVDLLTAWGINARDQ